MTSFFFFIIYLEGNLYSPCLCVKTNYQVLSRIYQIKRACVRVCLSIS